MKSERPKASTVRDVARVAGVSVGTVSRVVNDPEDVSPEARGKVERAILELDFRPNMFAQGMRSHSSMLVGCIIRDITAPPLALFFKTAQKCLEEKSYTLIVADSDGRKDRELELLKVFRQRRLDAMILQVYSDEDPTLNAAIRAANVPVALIDRNEPDWADSIVVDHKSGICQSTEYLISLGHRRIALLTGRPQVHASRARIEGFLEAYKNCGLPSDAGAVRCGGWTSDFGFEEASTVLGWPDSPTAIIVGALDMLPGVLRAIKARKLSIPGDVSLIASGDTQLAELTTPPISVVRWDLGAVGRLAASTLIDRLVGNPSPAVRRVILPTEFVLRGSCAPPPREAAAK